MAGIQNSGSQGYAVLVASIGIETLNSHLRFLKRAPTKNDANRKAGTSMMMMMMMMMMMIMKPPIVGICVGLEVRRPGTTANN